MAVNPVIAPMAYAVLKARFVVKTLINATVTVIVPLNAVIVCQKFPMVKNVPLSLNASREIAAKEFAVRGGRHAVPSKAIVKKRIIVLRKKAGIIPAG